MSAPIGVPESSPSVKNWRRGGWGWWSLVYLGLVAAIGLAHGLIGAYSPDLLPTIDAALSHLTEALRYVGLGVVRPGLNGSLGQEFYANQVGIAVWGVIFCWATNLILISKGLHPSIEPDKAIERMMKARNLSHAQAVRAIYLRLFGIALPLTGVFCFLFVNSFHGWYVTQIQYTDWRYLNFMTLLFTYGTGCLLGPLTFVSASWLYRLPRSFPELIRRNQKD